MKHVFLDTETTGLDFNLHVPIEICLIISDSDNNIVDFYHSFINISEEDYKNADPQALKVNGFSLSECRKNENDLSKTKEGIVNFLQYNEINKDNSFFMCQNPSFDRPFFQKIVDLETQKQLNLPYHWLDLASMFWIEFSSQKVITSLSKDSIAFELGLPPEEKPHSALRGALHLYECYKRLRRLDECKLAAK